MTKTRKVFEKENLKRGAEARVGVKARKAKEVLLLLESRAVLSAGSGRREHAKRKNEDGIAIYRSLDRCKDSLMRTELLNGRIAGCHAVVATADRRPCLQLSNSRATCVGRAHRGSESRASVSSFSSA